MKQKLFISLMAFMFSGLSFMFAQHTFAGGLYLSTLNSPTSLGTAGVNNVVNNVSADASFTNPAGMTGIKQTTIMPGFQIMIPEVKFDSSIAGAGGSDGGNSSFVSMIPGFNAVKVLSDKWRLGLAITAPLGGGVDYGDNFVGRYQATRSVLSGLGVSPALAYKINDKLSVGGGVTAIYTVVDMDIAINQGPLPDGKLSINQIDDWGAQGFIGLTWQVTDKAMIGVVYRTESSSKPEGDLDIDVAGPPPVNMITGILDEIELQWDFPQLIAIGLKYRVTENLALLADFDYEDWSTFSDVTIDIKGNTVAQGDLEFDDTWHVGIGALYMMDNSAVTAGLAYDSSAVDDKDRNLALPVDEQVKFGMSYAWKMKEKFTYAFGFSYVWLGDGKIDQMPQGFRVKGEFETNYFVSLGGNMRYRF